MTVHRWLVGVVAATLWLLAGCSSTSDTAGSASTAVSTGGSSSAERAAADGTTSTSPAPSTPTTGGAGAGAVAESSACDAIAPVVSKQASPTINQLDAALLLAPAEVRVPLERLRAVEVDPSLPDDRTELLLALGPRALDMVRDFQAVQDWHRRACGPESAASAWCESFAAATLARDLRMMGAMLEDPTASDVPAVPGGTFHETSLELYRTIVGAAPPAIAPKVQLIIDQYTADGGVPPTDEQAVRSREAAQDAIIASVRDECGITTKRSEL